MAEKKEKELSRQQVLNRDIKLYPKSELLIQSILDKKFPKTGKIKDEICDSCVVITDDCDSCGEQCFD
jgi:hypothetical protein